MVRSRATWIAGNILSTLVEVAMTVLQLFSSAPTEKLNGRKSYDMIYSK